MICYPIVASLFSPRRYYAKWRVDAFGLCPTIAPEEPFASGPKAATVRLATTEKPPDTSWHAKP